MLICLVFGLMLGFIDAWGAKTFPMYTLHRKTQLNSLSFGSTSTSNHKSTFEEIHRRINPLLSEREFTFLDSGINGAFQILTSKVI